MENLKLFYSPALDAETVRQRLLSLLVPGCLADKDLERLIDRMEERFRVYLSSYPYGLWTPGLFITDEMRGMTELYLPLAEIRRISDRFFSLSLKFTPFHAASPLHTAASWLDALERLSPLVRHANPARLFRGLMADEIWRVCFMFSVFLPKRYGGGFGRYPGQAAFLKRWLMENRMRSGSPVSCLDAACGCGEGTYELARLLLESGYSVDTFRVHGATLEPLELFAAAHGYFPHHPVREAAYRRHIQPLFAHGAAKRIAFAIEDVTKCSSGEGEVYDVILCNGLLGGPFLHRGEELMAAVSSLGKRLKPKGLLLAADRFHGGWKKLAPEGLLREIFVRAGLSLLPIEEGIGGIKRGPGTGDW
ncbi:MAG: hypothetical protein FD174_479 [Geobacteraceae bacterium]|nr:MAG: hypothetical protein FD174_479 [Geobacteraceae bacterium]